jgi:hypothetical protein
MSSRDGTGQPTGARPNPSSAFLLPLAFATSPRFGEGCGYLSSPSSRGALAAPSLPPTRPIPAEEGEEFRLRLKVRWRNVLALGTGGIGLFVVGAFAGLLGGAGGIGWVVLAVGAVFIGVAVYLLGSVHRGEAVLRSAGLRWRVETHLLQSESRTFLTLTAPDLALATAYEVLADPSLGLRDVSRGLHRVEGTLPPDGAGWLFISNYPLLARIHARPRAAGSELDIQVLPSWPAFAWVWPSGWWSWVGDSERLADQIERTLRARLPAATAVTVA